MNHRKNITSTKQIKILLLLFVSVVLFFTVTPIIEAASSYGYWLVAGYPQSTTISYPAEVKFYYNVCSSYGEFDYRVNLLYNNRYLKEELVPQDTNSVGDCVWGEFKLTKDHYEDDEKNFIVEIWGRDRIETKTYDLYLTVNGNHLPNEPPELNTPLPDVSFNEDQRITDEFDLDDHFSDEGPLSYSVTGNTHVKVSIDGGNKVDFWADANWSGTEDVTFTASDGELSVSDTMRVTVLPVNDAPFLTQPITDVSFDEDQRINDQFDLDNHFDDIDTNVLQYSAQGTNRVHVSIDANNNVDFWADANWSGTEDVTFTASDGELSVSDTMRVTVLPVNDAPFLTQPITDVSFDEDERLTDEFDLDNHFDDIDTNVLQYSAQGTNRVHVFIDANNNVDFWADANWYGTEDVTFTASDGELSVSDTMRVTVLPVNDAPFLTQPITDVSFDEDQRINDQFDLDNHFDDIDTNVLQYSAQGTNRVHVSIDANNNVDFWADANWYGTEDVTFTASDGQYSVSDTMRVTVRPINDPPSKTRPLPDVTFNEDQRVEDVFDLDEYFSDSDSTLHYYAEDNRYVHLLIDAQNKVDFWADPNWNGRENVVFVAYDEDYEVSDEIIVTVLPVNDPPLKPSNPDPFVGETDVTINHDLSWESGDIDGDVVTYDIYFGTTPYPPKVRSNHPTKSYDPGTLAYDTQYYWKIVARDSKSAETAGDLWYFTTEEEVITNRAPIVDDIAGYTNPDSGLINFTAQAHDPDPGDRVEKVEFMIRVDQRQWTTKCVDTVEPWNCAWDSTQDVPTKSENVEVRARAHDGDVWGDNKTKGPFTVDNDHTVPVITLIAPLNNAWVSGIDIDFRYQAYDAINNLSRCTLYVDGSNKGTHPNPQEGTPLTFSDIDLVDGTHSWWVNCTDTALDPNEGKSEVRTLYVDHGLGDRTPPVVQLLAPLNGETVIGVDIQFTYNVTDVDSGIASCNFYLNGVLDQTDTSVTERIPQTFMKASLNDGTYRWNISCTDDSLNRNVGYSTTWTLYVDHSLGNNAPIVDDIAGYTNPDSGLINFTAQAHDPDPGDRVETVEFQVKVGEGLSKMIVGQGTWETKCVDTVEPWNCAWDSTLDVPTKSEVEVRARAHDGDVWGDNKTKGPFTVDNDHTVPVITLIAPLNNAWVSGIDVDFTYQAYDEVNDLSSCTLYVDGSNKGTHPNPQEGTPLTFEDIDLVDGTHTWWVNCTDTALDPNEGKSEVRTLYVNHSLADTTPPVVQLLAPLNGETVIGVDIQFTYNVTDVDSGIASCNFYLNGVLDQTDTSITESIPQTFMKASLNDGTYQWNVSCTDDSLNHNVGYSTTWILHVNHSLGNNAPVASFTYDPVQPFVGDLVAFNGSASSDPDNDTLSYSWDFTNDGIEDANTMIANYTFTTAGIHPVTLTVSDGALSDIESKDVVVSNRPLTNLNVTELSCFERVVVNHNQSCSVFVEADGVPTGEAAVSLFYDNETFIGSCETNAISGGCAVLYPVTEAGIYTVYAQASKTGYLPDNDTQPDFTYTVFAERYDILNLATYNDTGFTLEDDDFFRGQNLYAKFQVYDLVEQRYVSDAVSSSTLVSTDGGGRAELSVYQSLNDMWYYYALSPIPLTHDFIGDSNVFAFTFNDLNQSGGQEQTSLLIRNNPPVITPAIGPVTTDLERVITINLTQHEFDLEDSGNNLRWSVEGVNESLAVVTLSEEKILTITPRAVGVDSFTLMLRDLDGDIAREEILLTIGEPRVTVDPIAIPGGPYETSVGIPLVVDGSKSYDPDGGNITRYDWNWGDSSSHSGGATPSHAYKEDGTYTLTLRVWDDEGEQGIATTTVIVKVGNSLSDRDKYPRRKLHISEVHILPEVAQPGSEVVIMVTVKNAGLRDEDSIKIEAFVPEWGEWQSRKQEDIDDGDSITERFVFTVPPTQRKGTYSLRIAVVTEDLVKRVLYRDIIVH